MNNPLKFYRLYTVLTSQNASLRVVQAGKFSKFSMNVFGRPFSSLPSTPSLIRKKIFGNGTCWKHFAVVGFCTGAIGQLLFNKWGEQSVGLPQVSVDCAPTPPQKLLLEPLKFARQRPSDPFDQQIHDFRYSHTQEAVDMGPRLNAATAKKSALSRSHVDWDNTASKLLGREYGKQKVHHVILASIDTITKDLKAQNKSKNWVSIDHTNWIWLAATYDVVTFMYDEFLENYRIYIYKGYCLIEVGKDANGQETIPIGIKFISDEKKPIKGQANDTSVKEVVEKFEHDFMEWQKNVYFVY